MKMRIDKGWKKWIDWLPILILLICLVLIHRQYNLQRLDDLTFAGFMEDPRFHLSSWLHTRYETWTSRILVEGVLMGMLALPVRIWKICNCLMFIQLAVLLSLMFFRKEQRFLGNYFVSCGILCTSFYHLTTAGVAATMGNYLWPASMGLLALYPLVKCLRKEKIRTFEYPIYVVAAIFSSNQEQVSVMLVLFYGVGICFLIYKKRNERNMQYLVLQLLIAGVSVLFAATCPGNHNRSIEETKHWLPQFAKYSFLKKCELGISGTLEFLFLKKNIPFLIFTLLLCALIMVQYRNKLIHVISFLPFFTCAIINAMRPYIGDNGTRHPFALVSNTGYMTKDNLSVGRVLLYVYLLYLCGSIIYLLYLTGKRSGGTYWSILILMVGLGSKAMMGFSPTVWVSDERTGWFLLLALLACSLNLLNKWNFEERQTVTLMMISSALLGVSGFITNYYGGV